MKNKGVWHIISKNNFQKKKKQKAYLNKLFLKLIFYFDFIKTL